MITLPPITPRTISTLHFVGLMQPAPGTWGSAAALAIGLILYRIGHFPMLLIATIAVTCLGFWVCRQELADQPGEDPSEIVIDEVAGQWVALSFPALLFWFTNMPSNNFPYLSWIAAFALFRLFDILKPWHVGRADQRGDADGVMLDDLWAGLFAGICTLPIAAICRWVLT